MKITYIDPKKPEFLQCLAVYGGADLSVERTWGEAGKQKTHTLRVNGRIEVEGSVVPVLFDGTDIFSEVDHLTYEQGYVQVMGMRLQAGENRLVVDRDEFRMPGAKPQSLDQGPVGLAG